MYTLEEYNRIQNDLEYQKKLIDNYIYNILKIHNQTEEVQLYFLKKYPHYFEFIKFPTEKVCLEALKFQLNIVYIDNPTEEMCWMAIKFSLETIKYIDIIKYPEIFKFYQKNYKKFNEQKFTMEEFKLINYDLDYQKENYKSINFFQIIKPSSEIIDFLIDNYEKLFNLSFSPYLTEEQQIKIVNKEQMLFWFFKFPKLNTLIETIKINPNNIEYIELDKYPEIYDYWRLLNI